MSRFILQESIEDISFENLPANWNTFDIKSFSPQKTLYDYQQKAVESAIKVLWQYYENLRDYSPKETIDVNQQRKEELYRWYELNGLHKNLDVKLTAKIQGLYVNDKKDYTDDFNIENGRIHYRQFINRMSFWMATGSGKSLVLVKLIEILKELIKRGEIPNNDILVLTHRDDLIDQLKTHVNEFNRSHPDFQIILTELKEYENRKLANPSLFKDRELTVFYYRSDNLSTEQKEKLIDFKNYDNNGQWYVFLDEAHKGDREESIRQHVFSILGRNGFLFNFSATFTDQRDILTCAREFNLASYIQKGYGKHLALLQQEVREFKKNEDFTDDEKQKIVLKSLITLAYTKQYYHDLTSDTEATYHNPLMLTLVNSVNTDQADLKLFFRELERIAKGEVIEETIESAKNELWEEFKEKPQYLFEDDKRLEVAADVFRSIGIETLWKNIFNSNTPGEIEVLIRSSNRQEVAFRVKASGNPQPFALIKIGDISGWLKDELGGYETQKGYEDETFFENLNKDSSEINILMGSRSFYEGWDSNRPNVVNFINIGTGIDAKKFVLQSIGRGVRIEPIKNKRRRLLNLYREGIVRDVFSELKDKTKPLETLFVFGTNRTALNTVLDNLKQQKPEQSKQLSLFKNEEAIKDKTLLVPTYGNAEEKEIKDDDKQKFELSENDQRIFNEYLRTIDDDRVLLINYDTSPKKIKFLRRAVQNKSAHFVKGDQDYKNIDVMIQRLFDYYDVIPQKLEGLKEIDEEINHFKQINVRLKDYDELCAKVNRMKDYPAQDKQLKKDYGKISPEEYDKQREALEGAGKYEDEQHKETRIEYIANHYYVPVLLTKEEKIDYVSNIINVPSEVDFIEDLKDNGVTDKDIDWWLFSKIDESRDQVYIPYYNPKTNKMSKFFPDFIFWLKRNDELHLLFVDPKGTEHASGFRKIDGFKQIFEENGDPKLFTYNGLNVKIHLRLKTKDISKVPGQYKYYWFDNTDLVWDGIR